LIVNERYRDISPTKELMMDNRREKREVPVKPIGIVIIGLFLMLPCAALSDDREAAVRTAIQAFYKAFDDGFVGPADYATEDWNHISPYGGRGQGRETVRAALNEVHKTFLKGTTDSIEHMDIRFATQDVAVGTVTSTMSPFTSPDAVKHGAEQHIRTFVVVKRGRRWLIMQDHNTTVIELPGR
jgi:uncharacterized protein (TIGR02246 family)